MSTSEQKVPTPLPSNADFRAMAWSLASFTLKDKNTGFVAAIFSGYAK